MDNKIVDINSKRFKKQSIEIQTQLLDDGSVWFRVKDGKTGEWLDWTKVELGGVQ